MTALKDDVPDLHPEHKYTLETNVKRTRQGINQKFRWSCLCGEKGEQWVHTAGLAGSGWTSHIEKASAARRAALYGDESSA